MTNLTKLMAIIVENFTNESDYVFFLKKVNHIVKMKRKTIDAKTLFRMRIRGRLLL